MYIRNKIIREHLASGSTKNIERWKNMYSTNERVNHETEKQS